MSLRHIIIIDDHATVCGGATRVAIDEARGLSAAGFLVTYLAAIGPICAELGSSSIRVILLDQHPLADSWKHPTAAFQSIWNRTAYRVMGELLDQANPQSTIVHVHGYSQTISASPVRCALDRGFEVVSTLHDYFAVCPNGGFFDYPMGHTCNRTPLSMSCISRNCDKRNYANKLYRVIKTIAQHRLSAMPSGLRTFIAVSESSFLRMKNYLPRDATFFLLQNPCSVSRAPPVAAATHNTVAAVGRLSPEKGIELLVRAARQTDTKLLFIGDGPLRHVAEAGGTYRVTGWVSHEEVLGLLNKVRCLVLPSLVPETHGLSVVDAAAKGVPSIVTDICGVAERIEHGKTGWRVPPGDVKALVAALDAVKNDSVVSNIGAAAYVGYWTAPLSLDSHIRAILKVYQHILERARQ